MVLCKKKYSLSKTLRFELKPVGKTLEYINENGVVSEDEHRAQSYKYVKSIVMNIINFL